MALDTVGSLWVRRVSIKDSDLKQKADLEAEYSHLDRISKEFQNIYTKIIQPTLLEEMKWTLKDKF